MLRTHVGIWVRWVAFALVLGACSASSTDPVVGEDAEVDVVGPEEDGDGLVVPETGPPTVDGTVETVEVDGSLPEPEVSPDVTVEDAEISGPGPCEGVDCDDGLPCNGVESCDEATGECVSGPAVACDDGSPCNGVESCDEATGACVTGLPVGCDDGLPCNGVESCDEEAGACVPGLPVICDDGLPCNGVESCDETTGACVSGQAVACDDGAPCNGVEICDEATGACVPGLPVTCDDGLPCNGVESCGDGTGICVSGQPVLCDDGLACNGVESCDDSTGACVSGSPVLCDDGDGCNGLEVCDPPTGTCLPGTPPCDDGDPCNGQEGCESATGTCVAGAPVVCGDGDECNGTETCDVTTGECVPGEVPDCDDGEPCTADACDPDVGCTVTPMCDDGDPCTVDICDAAIGLCDVEPKDCDDSLLCTVDTCNPENGACEHSLQPFGNPSCDDADLCTTDLCVVVCGGDGVCAHTCENHGVVCTDGNGCTQDTCEVATGECSHSDLDCDDEDACTDDWCAPNGGCFSTALSCDDDNPCTVDQCDKETGCSHTHTPLGVPLCDDDDPCTVDTCEPGGTCTTAPLDCDDGMDCTVDICDLSTGACEHDASGVGCDDGDPCTVDGCAGDGGCTSAPKDCGDNQKCTVDSCEADSGVCDHAWISCDDGNPCNGDEACEPGLGTCQPGTPVSCSDNDGCNGEETCDPDTGACIDGPPVDCEAVAYDGCGGPMACEAPGVCSSQGNPLCPVAPTECGGSGGVDGPESGVFTDSVAQAFVLKDQGQWEEKAELLDAIEAHWSTTPTTMETILFNNLNRTGAQITVPGVDCFKFGFYWNEGDNKVDYWWPQGVTNSGVGRGDVSKGEDGQVLDHDVLLVSWYHKADKDSSTSTYKGVRVSIVDVTYVNQFKYRHVILAEPVSGSDAAHPDLVPIASSSSSLHAGGIAWYGDYLYVADTSKGLRVFDLTRILQVKTGKKGSLGYVANADEYHGYNYRYVLPQVGRYKNCGQTCCARFSWVSVDPTTDPPSLLAGEYTSGSVKGRAHRWALDPETGRLALIQGVARAVNTYFPGVKKMQGGVTVNGALFISSSNPKLSLPLSSGTLYHASSLGGTMHEHQYPTLPEDLTYNPFWDDIWTCTEKPANWMGQTRFCFRVNRENVQSNGCD